MSKYWVRVHGPSATGLYGSDVYAIESPSDVTSLGDGVLQIVTAAEPKSEYRGRQTSRTVLYPAWHWTKVIIGYNPQEEVK